MASTNQSPEFLAAQKKYLLAKDPEEKLLALEEMLKTMPKHKSAEAMRANLRTRYKKLKAKIEEQEKRKKQSKSKTGIKKAEMQACLIGLTNSGKSSILSVLTNAHPEIASYEYTTKQPSIGTLDYYGVKIQLIDLPAIESEYFHQGVANTADLLLIIITNIKQLEEIFPFLKKATGKKLIIYNKIDLLNENEQRKIQATLKTKKFDFILFSCKTKQNIEQLKDKIFQKFGKIRIYTKDPRKKSNDNVPIILKQNSTVKNVAEKIFHGFSNQIKEIRITGPSSKFPNQKVGLSHVVKDKDIIEFKTR